jgi:DNA-binding beta-propeller fold protein YncE
VVRAESDASRRWRVSACALAAPLLLGACGAFREPAIAPITRVAVGRVEIPPIQGQTAPIDIMVVDQATHRMWVADRLDLGIDLIDISSVPGRYVRTIPNRVSPHGLVIAPDLQLLYSGNDDSTVSVIDINPASPKVNTVIKTIAINGQGLTDLMEYDPVDKKIYAVNPDDGMVTAISTQTDKVVGQIKNLPRVDQPRYDPVDGMLYATGIDENAVYKINPRTDTLISTTAIPVNCEPHGIAINPRTNKGVIGCADVDQPVALVWDFGANKMVRSFDQSGAGDVVIYDAIVNQFLFAASNYAPAEMSIFDGAGAINYLTSVPTSHKSHTVAYDETHNMIYTNDGRHREAGLWYFPNPVVGRH